MEYDLLNMNDEQLLALLELVWDHLSEVGKDDVYDNIRDWHAVEGGQ